WLAGGGLRRWAVLGSRPGLGERRGRRPRPVLERAPGHRRRRSGGLGAQQLRTRGGWVDGALRRLCPPVPSIRLPDVDDRRGGGRLAHHLRRPAAVLRRDGGGAAGGRAALAVG